MSSPKLVERFPALFWTPDEFDSPDTESARPIRVPLLTKIEGPVVVMGTKTLTRPAKPSNLHLPLSKMTDPEAIKKTAKLLGMETMDPGDPAPTVNIEKVGSEVVKEVTLDEVKDIQDSILYMPLDGTTEAIKNWLEEKFSGKPPFILESTPHKGPEDAVVTVETVGDFMDLYGKQIAEGLAVPEEYWNPEAGTNKGIMAQVCADCLLFGGAYLDPLSGNPVSVNCMSKCVAADSAAWKFFQESAGTPCPCVYFESKYGSKGN